ncbi:MAG: LemA family protein [Candidatus Kerfeldbacteria bacterium]|nr:LemA family protein [Candidatus Kerfeldbacteria bacterium]
MTITWIIVGIIVLILLWIMTMYNRLISLRNRTNESWSDIDVQLKRRYDLIPNLMETVKGYAKHEREAFENVTKARSAAMGAQTPHDKAQAENALSQTLKSIFAIAEAYPELKASANFAKLQDELSDTENKIQASRRFYNGNVRDFNTSQQTFPTNLLAQTFGFKPREFFEVEGEAEKQPVAVKF